MAPAKRSLIPPRILEAYQQTEYRVLGPAPWVLRVSCHSPELLSLHRHHGVDCSCLVTACNPLSRLQSDRQNRLAMERLEQVLRGADRKWIEAVGYLPGGDWPAEPSLLVLGCPLAEAEQLGKRFQQNAVLWSGSDGVPRLILMR
jgi:hypothetical protein